MKQTMKHIFFIMIFLMTISNVFLKALNKLNVNKEAPKKNFPFLNQKFRIKNNKSIKNHNNITIQKSAKFQKIELVRFNHHHQKILSWKIRITYKQTINLLVKITCKNSLFHNIKLKIKNYQKNIWKFREFIKIKKVINIINYMINLSM